MLVGSMLDQKVSIFIMRPIWGCLIIINVIRHKCPKTVYGSLKHQDFKSGLKLHEVLVHVNHYKLEDIERFESEIKELIKFKEVSNVKVNH